MEQIVIKFLDKEVTDFGDDYVKEYTRQLQLQENGLNKLTIQEYLNNRAAYMAHGRSKAGSVAQAQARQRAVREHVRELRAADKSLSRKDAKAQADIWIKTQAALHSPDQIAGGKADAITGLGNKKVNSSIGSQWGKKTSGRAKDLEEKILELIGKQESLFVSQGFEGAELVKKMAEWKNSTHLSVQLAHSNRKEPTPGLGKDNVVAVTQQSVTQPRAPPAVAKTSNYAQVAAAPLPEPPSAEPDLKYIFGVEVVDVGEIKISPFEFESILEIKIEKELNEHSTLYVCGIIRDDKQFSPVTGVTEGTSIKCEHEGKVYFSGVLQSIQVTCVNAVYRLEAYAVSNTILLDTVKHKRSFQDNGQSYQSIVETVVADSGASVKYNAEATMVKNIILQYNETDWEFAKRLASHTKDVLMPITADSPDFHFGATDNGDTEWELKNYAVVNGFYENRRFDAPGGIEAEENINPLRMTDCDVTLYPAEKDIHVCDLGEKLILNGNDLRVCHVSISFMDSSLSVVYTACAKPYVCRAKFYNLAITGLILDGTVTEVENDTLKLKLDNDKERGVEQDTEAAHFFKYATDYSMETHTGWYVMPEEGDTVQLFFPNEDEKFAYATSAIRQEDTERTVDHMVKYWRTSYGREIKMDKEKILITTVDDVTFIRIHKDNGEGGESLGIEVVTPNRVLVKSGSKINIESDDDMTVTTGKNLYIEAKESIEMKCEGNNMKFIPDNGIALMTDKEYQQVSGGNVTVDGNSEILTKAGKDMTIDSGSKLAGGAETSIEMTRGQSEIVLDAGGVGVAGSMINES